LITTNSHKPKSLPEPPILLRRYAMTVALAGSASKRLRLSVM
jgi:hypothetical protein